MSRTSHLAPAGRPATIEEISRTHGADGVIDLVVGTLTNRRRRSDADIDENLVALKDACRQTRRYREALPVLRSIAANNPRRRQEMAAEIALVHRHLGEHEVAIAVLEAAISEQRSLPAGKRSLPFALVAEIAAVVLGRRELAAECARLGRSSVAPAPSARAATTARTATPNASRAAQRPTSMSPSAGPTVGRRRAKGPVRQLSVLTAAGASNVAEAVVARHTRPLLTVVGGTAA